MPVSSPTVDRRVVPSVAIIGNDTVLAAAPATPVQLAHACLRRGFAVAVPVSWGDELVAAETARRLASRERGPAVMCVCPFVRSRLLTPGPDLAPFLVALVSPPVATARYIRAVYGDVGVHVTYIGGCPSADDAAIDACLTPDAFLADLAEHDIALSEQPLVFDSVVPPDRRRWSSLPGGVPTADVLWSETDARTLIEIDADDVSTDLAQHIITHEHVLLDLAPSLGCVCSGAIPSVSPRSARVAVTALEPPRALGPILDPATLVALDMPVGGSPVDARRERPISDVPPTGTALLEQHLDVLLGTPVVSDPVPDVANEFEGMRAVVAVDTALGAETGAAREMRGDEHAPIDSAPATSVESPSTQSADAAQAMQNEPEPSILTGGESEVIGQAETPPVAAEASAPPATVRRSTTASTVVRPSAASIPRATASDGRPLPRAYIAKRRTPVAGIPSVSEPTVGVTGELDPSVSLAAGQQSEAPQPTSPGAVDEIPTATPLPSAPPDAEQPISATDPGHAAETELAAPSASAESAPSGASEFDVAQQRKPSQSAAVTAPDTGSLVVILLALAALSFFVIRSLN